MSSVQLYLIRTVCLLKILLSWSLGGKCSPRKPRAMLVLTFLLHDGETKLHCVAYSVCLKHCSKRVAVHNVSRSQSCCVLGRDCKKVGP